MQYWFWPHGGGNVPIAPHWPYICSVSHADSNVTAPAEFLSQPPSTSEVSHKPLDSLGGELRSEVQKQWRRHFLRLWNNVLFQKESAKWWLLSQLRENNSTGYFPSRFYILGCVRKPSFHTDMVFSRGGETDDNAEQLSEVRRWLNTSVLSQSRFFRLNFYMHVMFCASLHTYSHKVSY